MKGNFPDFYASPQELYTKTGDGRNLVVLSGYAVLNFKGSGGSWRRVTGEMVRGPKWKRLDDVVPIISLAAIANQGHAIEAGWALGRRLVQLVQFKQSDLPKVRACHS